MLLRSVYFHIWNNALVKEQPVYESTNWGWKLCDGKFVPLWMTQGEASQKFVPLWMTQGEASQECRELVKCSCTKLCTGRCRCKKAELPCTEHCQCGGGGGGWLAHIIRLLITVLCRIRNISIKIHHGFLRALYISNSCKLTHMIHSVVC